MAPKRRTNRNRVLGDRLWDDSGVEWSRNDTDLPRERIESLLRRPDVRVGIHQSMALRWVDNDDKLAVWRSAIEPNFHDRPDYRPPADAPGQKPFLATLWQSRTRELLLFDDFD